MKKKKDVCIDAILSAVSGKNPRAVFLLGSIAVWLHRDDVARAKSYLEELVRYLGKEMA